MDQNDKKKEIMENISQVSSTLDKIINSMDATI